MNVAEIEKAVSGKADVTQQVKRNVSNVNGDFFSGNYPNGIGRACYKDGTMAEGYFDNSILIYGRRMLANGDTFTGHFTSKGEFRGLGSRLKPGETTP